VPRLSKVITQWWNSACQALEATGGGLHYGTTPLVVGGTILTGCQPGWQPETGMGQPTGQ